MTDRGEPVATMVPLGDLTLEGVSPRHALHPPWRHPCCTWSGQPIKTHDTATSTAVKLVRWKLESGAGADCRTHENDSSGAGPLVSSDLRRAELIGAALRGHSVVPGIS